MDRLLEATYAYGECRDLQLILHRRLQTFRCDNDQLCDDTTVRCYFAGSDLCESCARREPIYQEWRTAKQQERKALHRLQYLLVRAKEGR